MFGFNFELPANTASCITAGTLMPSPATIVFVADKTLYTGLVQHLDRCGYRLMILQSEADYLQAILALRPDIILLDQMPGNSKGFEVCQQLKQSADTAAIPVIFITDQMLADPQNSISAFQLGAVDYLNKSMSNTELQARIDIHLNLSAKQQKSDADNLQLLNSLNAQIATKTIPAANISRYEIIADNKMQRRGLDFLGLADNIPDLIVCYDVACRRTYLNRAYTEKINSSVEGIMGTTPLQNWVKNSSVTAEQYMRYLQRVIASAEVLEFMFDYEDSNGSSLFYSVVLSPDFDDAGAVIGVLAISRNITALHKMLDRLHKSENEFRTLAENSPEMIIRYDLNLDQIYHNPAYAHLNYTFPYLPRRKQASKLSDCLVSWQDYSSKLQQVIANGQSQHILLEWRALDGSMVSHDMHIVAEYAASGEVVSLLAMGHDVTQLKLSEQHLKESRAELRMLTIKREQAREQERKRIAREIHDELGQLLSVMRLGVSSLDLSFGEAIPYLHERVEKITNTIDHAILVARCLATRLRPAVLSAGIVYALEWMIEDYAENSHIDFKLSVSSGNFALEEERAVMVFRIVQESITNAVRHSAADRVEVALTCLEDSYEIEVRDNGIGFDTAKSVKRHSYGLVGMKERAMILGGVLEFSSECGLGTKIKLCIPMTKTTQEMNCGEH